METVPVDVLKNHILPHLDPEDQTMLWLTCKHFENVYTPTFKIRNVKNIIETYYIKFLSKWGSFTIPPDKREQIHRILIRHTNDPYFLRDTEEDLYTIFILLFAHGFRFRKDMAERYYHPSEIDLYNFLRAVCVPLECAMDDMDEVLYYQKEERYYNEYGDFPLEWDKDDYWTLLDNYYEVLICYSDFRLLKYFFETLPERPFTIKLVNLCLEYDRTDVMKWWPYEKDTKDQEGCSEYNENTVKVAKEYGWII